MADLTIDMEERSLEDAASQLDDADLDADETLTIALQNLDARTALAFFDGALDADYRVTLTELRAQATGNQTIIQMLDDDEIVHIDELTVELTV